MNIEKILEFNEDSFYLYDEEKLENSYVSFLKNFEKLYSKVNIAYSFKTNYMPNLCKKIISLGGISEVVSEMELDLALKLSKKNKIIFNGPYKSEKSIAKAIDNNVIIHIDNYYEFNTLMKIISNYENKKCKIGLRVNLNIDPNEVSRFGLDINDQDYFKILKKIENKKQIKLVGIHCHLPNRDLKSFKYRIDKMLDIYNKNFFDKIEYIDIGGGFPSIMDKNLAHQLNFKNLKHKDYARIICDKMNYFFSSKKIKKPILIIEPGTAIVANCLNFYTKIIAKKKIGDKNILLAAGSKFNFMGMQTKNLNFSHKEYYNNNSSGGEKRKCDIGGYTCIESDYILKDINSSLNVGDYVCIENVGSYSIVMKPPFILPNVPIFQIYNNQIKCIKREENVNDIFNTYLEYE